MKQCQICGFITSDDLSPRCPNCGNEWTASAAESPRSGVPRPPSTSIPTESSLQIVEQYFRNLRDILLHPVLFFRNMPPRGGISGPLAFALVTHWIGVALKFLWIAAMGGFFGNYYRQMMKMMGDAADVDHPGRGALFMQIQNQLGTWLWGAGQIIIDPFLTLISVLSTSFIVFLGAKLLVPSSPPANGDIRHPVTFETALRIVAYGMAPAILAGIPILGTFVPALYTLVVTTVGVREVYRITTFRAAIVALFPKLLVLGIIMTGVIAVVLIVLKLISSMA